MQSECTTCKGEGEIWAEPIEVESDLPKPLEKPNFYELERLVQDLIENMYMGKYHPNDDWKNFIYAEAIRTVYGENIFKWINKNTFLIIKNFFI